MSIFYFYQTLDFKSKQDELENQFYLSIIILENPCCFSIFMILFTLLDFFKGKIIHKPHVWQVYK